MMDFIQEEYTSIEIKYASSNDKKTNQRERKKYYNKNFSLYIYTKDIQKRRKVLIISYLIIIMITIITIIITHNKRKNNTRGDLFTVIIIKQIYDNFTFIKFYNLSQ